ncbi:MAG: T9SS type A sorting domain-containing protein, partial [Bacteroidales bacterium]|nr:T9SS type A sorting domain-containing protein [Bacteroidales bacterium]
IPSYNQYGFAINYPCTWSLYDSTDCLGNLLRSRGLPYDTIFVGINYDNSDPWATVTDTLIACRFEESPWLKKDDKWVRFADDSVYNIFQKTFIEFLPILKVARVDTASLEEEISIDNKIKLYPNPAENTLNVESQDIIKEIEFFDALGKKAKAITLNKKEAIIDISSLTKGNYVVNLITDKGKITKKLVVK